MERAELPPSPPVKAFVSSWALMIRINRKLSGANLRLKRSKGTTRIKQLGKFYVLDRNANLVKQRNVNIEKLARQLKCLEPWEELEKGGE